MTRGHVLGDVAENVKDGRVGGGDLTLGGPDHDDQAVGQIVAEATAIAIDAGSCTIQPCRQQSIGK